MNLYFSRNVNNYSMIDVTGALKGYFDKVDRGVRPILARYEDEQFSVFAMPSRNESLDALYDLFIVACEDEAQSDGLVQFFKFDRDFLRKLISSYENPVTMPLGDKATFQLQ